MISALIIVAVLALVVGAILYLITDDDRYSKMSEQEFQEEADRGTLTGAAVMGLHKVLQPKRVEYILQRDKRVEGEQRESGDKPHDETVETPSQPASQ
jgi:hypothetical protein